MLWNVWDTNRSFRKLSEIFRQVWTMVKTKNSIIDMYEIVKRNIRNDYIGCTIISVHITFIYKCISIDLKLYYCTLMLSYRYLLKFEKYRFCCAINKIVAATFMVVYSSRISYIRSENWKVWKKRTKEIKIRDT